MGASNGRTKRSVERGKGGTRNTAAQTSRQEAQAVELVRRAFASSNGRLWDDVPHRYRNNDPYDDSGRKEAWFDPEVLQRQNVNSMWPYPERGDPLPETWNSSRGSDVGRNIRQDRESSTRSMWERYDGQGREPSPMRSFYGEPSSRGQDPFQQQQWQPLRASDYNDSPDPPWSGSDYNDTPTVDRGDGFIEALTRIFGR